MSNPSPYTILRCKEAFPQVMEHCVGLSEQEFQDFLKFMKEMIDTRYEFIRCYPAEPELEEIEVRELPPELHEFAVIYS